MRYPGGERGSSANKLVMDVPQLRSCNYCECVCVCVCWPLPSNQSFYRQILAISWVECGTPEVKGGVIGKRMTLIGVHSSM